MKQILSAAAIFLMSLSSTSSPAQSNADVTLALSSVAPANASGLTSVEMRPIEVNVKAMRDFSRSYKNAPQAKWYKSTSGSFATFDENGSNTKIVYDNNGRRSYSIISYPANKLDRSIRSHVMGNYFDATIIGVHQFEFENKTVYVIKMLDQASRPFTLKVCDGQIEDITNNVTK